MYGYIPTARLVCPWDFFRQEYWDGLPFPPQGITSPYINGQMPKFDPLWYIHHKQQVKVDRGVNSSMFILVIYWIKINTSFSGFLNVSCLMLTNMAYVKYMLF